MFITDYLIMEGKLNPWQNVIIVLMFSILLAMLFNGKD